MLIAIGTVSGADRIAFVANLDGNWDLFVVESQGRAQRLTETPLDERAPALSPRGSRVVYSTSDGALWMLDLGTRRKAKLDLPAGHYNHPRWSADEQSVVYATYTYSKDSEDADLAQYSFSGQKSRPFLTQPGVQDYPAWSPAGDRLIYSTSVPIAMWGQGTAVVQQLWVASLTGGRPRTLLDAIAKDTEPAWSPDGRTIAFSSDRSGNFELWLVDADGRNLRRLTQGPGAKSHPAWSPGGDSIAYVAADGGKTELAVIDVRSRTVRTLSPFGADRRCDIRDPDWR